MSTSAVIGPKTGHVYARVLGDNAIKKTMPQDSPSPLTPDQVSVQQSLGNLMDFIDTLHDYCQDKIDACFQFESIIDPPDPGNDQTIDIVTNVLLGAFSSLSECAAFIVPG